MELAKIHQAICRENSLLSICFDTGTQNCLKNPWEIELLRSPASMYASTTRAASIIL